MSNPILNYFTNLPKWDGTDYIGQLSNYITVADYDKERFVRNFKKMFVRMIASGIKRQINKQIFVLVQNKQNSGKSTFFRWLCPPALKYTEGITFDRNGLVALSENFMINLDELSVLSKHDINELKVFLSRDIVMLYSVPDRCSYRYTRIASFVASTNDEEFLSDATGNTCWVFFKISNINWNYKDDFDINNVWAQAYALFIENANYGQLTESEIKENETANEKFYQ